MAKTNGSPISAANRVVVLAPIGRDAALVCQALAQSDIDAIAIRDSTELVAIVREGAGVLLITEEALSPTGTAALRAALDEQPSWSDLPVLLLLAAEDRPVRKAAAPITALQKAGHVTVLVRPVFSVSLVTAVQSALRSRHRQYEVRDLIEREHAARLDAEQANRVKDEFLANVSHELRTPLCAILLWSRLLGSGRVDAARTQEALDSIALSAESQSRLIEDLLDVSRMLSGQLRLNTEEVDVAHLVEDALAVVKPMANAKKISVEFVTTTASSVRGDPHRLRQVIWNLLNNAIKFTPEGGRVAIHVTGDASNIWIRVVDTGKGIAAEFLPHVFDRFRQGDSASTRRQGGLGLGLAIAQQLVELHGGSITVESKGIDQGAMFLVRLPVARLACPALQSASTVLPSAIH